MADPTGDLRLWLDRVVTDNDTLALFGSILAQLGRVLTLTALPKHFTHRGLSTFSNPLQTVPTLHLRRGTHKRTHKIPAC